MNDRLKSALKYIGLLFLGILLGAILMKALAIFLHAPSKTGLRKSRPLEWSVSPPVDVVVLLLGCSA
jgi:hypothetical protein